jgi:hypothetical protein
MVGMANSAPSFTPPARPQPEARTRKPEIRKRHFMVGMANSAPSFTPDGQREVIVLVLV